MRIFLAGALGIFLAFGLFLWLGVQPAGAEVAAAGWPTPVPWPTPQSGAGTGISDCTEYIPNIDSLILGNIEYCSATIELYDRSFDRDYYRISIIGNPPSYSVTGTVWGGAPPYTGAFGLYSPWHWVTTPTVPTYRELEGKGTAVYAFVASIDGSSYYNYNFDAESSFWIDPEYCDLVHVYLPPDTQNQEEPYSPCWCPDNCPVCMGDSFTDGSGGYTHLSVADGCSGWFDSEGKWVCVNWDIHPVVMNYSIGTNWFGLHGPDCGCGYWFWTGKVSGNAYDQYYLWCSVDASTPAAGSWIISPTLTDTVAYTPTMCGGLYFWDWGTILPEDFGFMEWHRRGGDWLYLEREVWGDGYHQEWAYWPYAFSKIALDGVYELDLRGDVTVTAPSTHYHEVSIPFRVCEEGDDGITETIGVDWMPEICYVIVPPIDIDALDFEFAGFQLCLKPFQPYFNLGILGLSLFGSANLWKFAEPIIAAGLLFVIWGFVRRWN